MLWQQIDEHHSDLFVNCPLVRICGADCLYMVGIPGHHVIVSDFMLITFVSGGGKIV